LKRRHFNGLALALAGLGTSEAAMALTENTSSPALLILGDSLSAEYGLPRGTGWVALLQQRLQAQQIRLKVVNASISGDTTSGGHSRLPALLDKHRPILVVIELGGNDALRGLPIDQTRQNLSAMVSASLRTGAKVLLLGMEMPPNYGRRFSAEFRQMYAEVARQHRAALVPFFLKGVADGPDPLALFQADRIHPNQAAQSRMLDNVWPALLPLLPRH